MTTTLLAGEGWDQITGIVGDTSGKFLVLGVTLLSCLGIFVALKVAGKGKGNARDAIGDIGIWLLAGVVLGLAMTAPKIMSSLGQDVGDGGSSQVQQVDGR